MHTVYNDRDSLSAKVCKPAPTSGCLTVALMQFCMQSIIYKALISRARRPSSKATHNSKCSSNCCDPSRCQSFSMRERVMHATAIGTETDERHQQSSICACCVVITHPILDCTVARNKGCVALHGASSLYMHTLCSSMTYLPVYYPA